MTNAENKTSASSAPVAEFLAAVAQPTRHADPAAPAVLYREATGGTPRLRGRRAVPG